MLLRPGPAATRNKIRDKRIEHPWLWIDLNERRYSTRLWSPSRFIMDVLDNRLVQDQEFCAVARLDNKPDVFLMDSVVTMHDRKNAKMAINYEMTNPEQSKMMFDVYSESKNTTEEEGKTRQLPMLDFSIAYKSVNWSLTGFMIANFTGKVEIGQTFTGLIRLPKTQRTGGFRAQAVRYQDNVQGLGCRFLEMSQTLFDMLEYALKRSENP
ncbi:hypothetical protein ACFSM5_18045 [Lacibacterium aquatile]|uniref:PilZ domain-containing protein n=1 Tax=Lacibacterium aquatile TaxID=1168082 RepID=A0ABW5DVS3_9PROT